MPSFSKQRLPLVSIIIPCYNAQSWIAETIESCLRQSYQPIEIIVIDDGSIDDSLAIIRSFENQVMYMTGPNRGGCHARNRGFEASHGEYIMFLDADDLIASDTISVLVEALHGRENEIAHCNWRYFRQKGEIRHTYKPTPIPKGLDDVECELLGYFAPPGSLLFPRRVIDSVYGWDEQLAIYQDVDLKLRCFLDEYRLLRVKGGKYFYRLHNLPSVSKSKSERAFHSRLYSLEKIEKLMQERDKLEKYKLTLAQTYQRLAEDAIAAKFFDIGQRSLAHAKSLSPRSNQTSGGTRIHRLLSAAIGESHKEQLAVWLMKWGIGRSVRKAFYDD